MAEAYRGRRLALLTQHGKEGVIAPTLEGALGCTVERALGFDTDQLGTFTREVPRAGTQLEAARRKAELAIELSGTDGGLGSEGSVDLHPMLGFIDRNVELVVLVDRTRGIRVVGVAEGPAPDGHVLTSSLTEAEALAARPAFGARSDRAAGERRRRTGAEGHPVARQAACGVRRRSAAVGERRGVRRDRPAGAPQPPPHAAHRRGRRVPRLRASRHPPARHHRADPQWCDYRNP